MTGLGVRRLVCQTGAMTGTDPSNWSGLVRRFVRSYRRRFRAIAEDRDAQERAVRESDLDWTIVRPFRISHARGVGRVRAAPAIRISFSTSVRSADLGEFLVDELTGSRFRRQAVFVVKG